MNEPAGIITRVNFTSEKGTDMESHRVILYSTRTVRVNSHKRTVPVQAPFSSRTRPVQLPYTPRSAPVQAPFAINWLSRSCFCAVCPFFCTAEFLARAKLKSKAKKTTEKLGSTKKIFRGLRRTSALRALDSKLRSKRGRCRTCSIANSGLTSWHWYPSFQMVV